MSNYELLYEIDEHIRQISQIRKMLPQYHRKLKRYRKTVFKILQKNLNLVDQQLEELLFANIFQDSEDTLASNVEDGPPEMDEEEDK